MENTSPTPIKPLETATKLPNTINFSDAIKKIAEGQKIHKLEWEDKQYYGFLNDDILCLHKPDGSNYKWIINEGDLSGTDYVVV